MSSVTNSKRTPKKSNPKKQQNEKEPDSIVRWTEDLPYSYLADDFRRLERYKKLLAIERNYLEQKLRELASNEEKPWKKLDVSTYELHEIKRQLSNGYDQLKSHFKNLSLVEHQPEAARFVNLKMELEIRMIEKELCMEENPSMGSDSRDMTPNIHFKRQLRKMANERSVLREQANERAKEAFLLEMKFAEVKVDMDRVKVEAAALKAERELLKGKFANTKDFQRRQRDLEDKEHRECATALQALSQQQSKMEQYWKLKAEEGKQSVSEDSKGLAVWKEQLSSKLGSLDMEINEAKERIVRIDSEMKDSSVEEMRTNVSGLMTKLTESISLNNRLLKFYEQLLS